MFGKAHDLTMKVMLGEEITEDERKYLHERDAKYKIVRHIYMEKMNHDKLGLKDFQFTPGDAFDDTPIIDIVNDLLKINLAIKEGRSRPLDFGDSRWKSIPPHSGREKTTL